MKTAFLINGFRLNKTPTHPDFKLLRAMLGSKGYKIADTNVTWNNKTVSSFAAEFTKIYKAQKTEHNVVIGNSLGAMMAFVSASQLKPDKLILCSLSPFFQEDLHTFDEAYLLKRFGKRRLLDFRTLSAKHIAKQINEKNIESVFLYGEIERSIYPRLVERVRESADSVKNARLVEAPKAGHRMYEQDYVETIENIL